jgi:hypothetical protein
MPACLVHRTSLPVRELTIGAGIDNRLTRSVRPLADGHRQTVAEEAMIHGDPSPWIDLSSRRDPDTGVMDELR